MHLECTIENHKYAAALNKAIDLSQSFGPQGDNPSAFHIPEARINPIQVGDFIGSVAAGSGANCEVIKFCAHGNGTHTECLGHITRERNTVNRLIQGGLMTACLISVSPILVNEDWIITLADIKAQTPQQTDAIIIRTADNQTKRSKDWSGTNPCYFEPAALAWLADCGYTHLLTDLPSVDREEDGGALSAHHAWWNYPQNPRTNASITELIVVPTAAADGLYLLNLSFAPIESDAAPSRPVIYPLTSI